MSGWELEVLPGRYAVCRLPPDATDPAWAQGWALVSLTRTPEELSVVCPEGSAPDDVRKEVGFRILRVAGPLEFSQTGVLAAIAQPLAAATVSIFALSTFDTDYVFVREHELDRSVTALTRAGHHLMMER